MKGSYQSLLAIVITAGIQLHESMAAYTESPANDTLSSEGGLSARKWLEPFPESDGIVLARRTGPPLDMGNHTSTNKRAVWNPTITDPTSATVWVAGSTVRVSW